MSYQTIGVIGAGAWGTALAQTLSSSGRDVTIWSFEPDCADAINKRHVNDCYLDGVPLDPRLKATSEPADLAGSDAILSVAPAQHTRATLQSFAPHIASGTPVLLCSKGIEISSRAFMAGVLRDVLPDAVPAVLSGPSFAADVARGLPTAVTLACEDARVGEQLVEACAAPTFRPYLTDDVIGAEIGGAVKNVLAIVCGIVLGKGLGRSAHAAIMARGFAEMTRLGKALGARPETLTGLCGLGDLVLTCSSEMSRNMSCGLALGRGESLNHILENRLAVTEGVATAPALKTLALDNDVEMPISFALADILSGDLSVDDAMIRLMSREHRSETE
ncbi:glycerol-3-phosphate dehydrogenase [NAD(P)+] [Algimonas porphyrae]|uniref:Glycerol-3-phosphate dehydrogenase [NAD(P)+] n=1 Tax=Algimonas porphyrae TaxID=1128113 RepID=A0ABQ5UZF6_9PROT|nr:NAD(P)H-dependent glycerol-3-phosphate dehydrogenase [Algimonas porphyrae]GLQ20155.1 glycerol-3-phosphate dehydrogenase [NAD(P)+] [Algimonas porphyrae]